MRKNYKKFISTCYFIIITKYQRGGVAGLKDLCTEKFGGKCRVTADKRILSVLGAQMLSALSIYIFKNLRENSV